MKSLHNINHPTFCPSDPVSEFHIVGNCGAQHNYSYMLWEHDDSLLPNNSSFLVVYVMDLIKNYPFYIPDHLGPSIKVVSQNLCCHDYARCLRIHRDISRDYSNWLKLLTQLPILLIAKCLDWGSVDNFSFMFVRQGYTILRYYCLTCARMCSHEDWLLFL